MAEQALDSTVLGGDFVLRIPREIANSYANLIVGRKGGSMGRVASCGDNATVDSLFTLLQKDVRNNRKRTQSASSSVISPAGGAFSVDATHPKISRVRVVSKNEARPSSGVTIGTSG